MKEYIFKLTDKVRDYECDLQGVVNNSNYQHYMEHTRHEFLLSTGVSFAGLHEQGVDPVVARINMAFKTPLMRRASMLLWPVWISSSRTPCGAAIGILLA